jgi:hypothetical protein
MNDTTLLPFRQWLWQDRHNRLLLILAAIAVIAQLTWYKYLYPFPNFLPDSYSYISTAMENRGIDLWPAGYAKFLRMESVLTHTHIGLVIIQYLLLQGCILYWIFTVAYLLKPNKWILRVLVFCNVLNPLLLHIANFISADALFVSCSIVWLAQLLWLWYKPDWRLLIWHVLLLLFVFSVRYNALFYPFISIAVLLLSKAGRRMKLAGVAMICITIGGFIVYMMQSYKTTTGTREFSAFGGWQMGANGLFAYSQLNVPPEQVPPKFKALHAITRHHIDSLRHLAHRPDTALGIYYLWDEGAPLKTYMYEQYKSKKANSSLQMWATVSPLYASYGAWLITKYPMAYLRYYVWPNTINYYVPPPEFLAMYNMYSDHMDPAGVKFFDLNPNKVFTRVKYNQVILIQYFPQVLALTNLIFFLLFICIILLNGLKLCTPYTRQILGWIMVVWLANLGFSVLASPIVLRYQLFPLVFTFTFMVLLIPIMAKAYKVSVAPNSVAIS